MLVFLASTFASFIGSLQIGPVNMAIMHKTLRQDRLHAFLMGIGACIPELVYSFLAVVGINSISNWKYYPVLEHYFPVIVLGGVGLFFIFKKPTIYAPEKAPSKGSSMLTGAGIGFLNPQLITFWATVILYMKGYKWLYYDSLVNDAFFVAGSAVGAFALFTAVIQFTHYNKAYFRLVTRKYNLDRWIGATLLTFALIKLFI